MARTRRQRRRQRFNYDGQQPVSFRRLDLPPRPVYRSRWEAPLSSPAPAATIRTEGAQRQRKPQNPLALRGLYRLISQPCIPLSERQKQFGSGSGAGKRRRGRKAIRRASVSMLQLKRRSC